MHLRENRDRERERTERRYRNILLQLQLQRKKKNIAERKRNSLIRLCEVTLYKFFETWEDDSCVSATTTSMMMTTTPMMMKSTTTIKATIPCCRLDSYIVPFPVSWWPFLAFRRRAHSLRPSCASRTVPSSAPVGIRRSPSTASTHGPGARSAATSRPSTASSPPTADRPTKAPLRERRPSLWSALTLTGTGWTGDYAAGWTAEWHRSPARKGKTMVK